MNQEKCCEKNCPDYNGMAILHSDSCDCPCHTSPKEEVCKDCGYLIVLGTCKCSPKVSEWDTETILLDFLAELENKVFIKSTNSVTFEEEILEPVIQDMEATIKLNGEWDREDLLHWFESLLSSTEKRVDEEWVTKLKEIHNKCKTERGLSVALTNLIKSKYE